MQSLNDFLARAERLDKEAMRGPWKPEMFTTSFMHKSNRDFAAFARLALPKAVKIIRILMRHANEATMDHAVPQEEIQKLIEKILEQADG